MYCGSIMDSLPVSLSIIKLIAMAMSNGMHTVIPLQPPCVSTQMVGITVGYKTLILSTQFKQDEVYRSDSPHYNPSQSSPETLPAFLLQCFHRNGLNHSGVRNFNPFHSVLLPTGMGGKLKNSSSCIVTVVNLFRILHV